MVISNLKSICIYLDERGLIATKTIPIKAFERTCGDKRLLIMINHIYKNRKKYDEPFTIVGYGANLSMSFEKGMIFDVHIEYYKPNEVKKLPELLYVTGYRIDYFDGQQNKTSYMSKSDGRWYSTDLAEDRFKNIIGWRYNDVSRTIDRLMVEII